MSAYFLGIFFILIHLFSNSFIPADRIRRNKWLSFSGGLAVSYVFVYVLPSLHREQQAIEWHSSSLTMESELYFICLLGLLLFYRVQKTVKTSQKVETHRSTFWLHIIFFALYNMLIVYVVMAANVSFIQAIFYGVAIGFHFIAVAHDLWRENPEQYNKIGRFILAFGIIAGWFTGMFLTLSTIAQAMIFAFISGAMILNVLQNELPKERHAHFPSFAIGVLSYTTITLALKFFFEW